MYTTTTTLSIDNVQSILSLSFGKVCVCVEAQPSRYMYTDEIRKEKRKTKKIK